MAESASTLAGVSAGSGTKSLSRVCQKLAFIGVASATGVRYTLYMKVALPITTTPSTYHLFEDTPRLLRDSIDALTPEGHAPALSESASRAADALGIPVSLGLETDEIPLARRGRRPSGSRAISGFSHPRIIVANFCISIFAPGTPESTVMGATSDLNPASAPNTPAKKSRRASLQPTLAGKKMYLVTLQLDSPVLQRPPDWPFLVRCPIPFCLNSSLRFSLDESAIAATSSGIDSPDADHSVVIDVQPTLISRSKSRHANIAVPAADATGDTSDSEDEDVEQFTVQGRFQSAEAVVVRWTDSAAGYQGAPNEEPPPIHAARLLSDVTVSLQESPAAGDDTVLLHYDWKGRLEDPSFPSLRQEAILPLVLDCFQQEAGWKDLNVTCDFGYARGVPNRSLTNATGHDRSASSSPNASLSRASTVSNLFGVLGEDTSTSSETLDDTDDNLYLARLPRGLKHTASDSSFDHHGQQAPAYETAGVPVDQSGDVTIVIDVSTACGRGGQAPMQQVHLQLQGVVAVRTTVTAELEADPTTVLETFALPILRAPATVKVHECAVRIVNSSHGHVDLVRGPQSAISPVSKAAGSDDRTGPGLQTFTVNLSHVALAEDSPISHGTEFGPEAGILSIRRPLFARNTSPTTQLLNDDVASISTDTMVPHIYLDGTPTKAAIELPPSAEQPADLTSSTLFDQRSDALTPAYRAVGEISAATLEVWPYLPSSAGGSGGRAVHKLTCTWPCTPPGESSTVSHPIYSLLLALDNSMRSKVDIVHVLVGGVQQLFEWRDDPSEGDQDVADGTATNSKAAALLVRLPSTADLSHNSDLLVEVMYQPHADSKESPETFELYMPTFASAIHHYITRVHWPHNHDLQLETITEGAFEHYASDPNHRVTTLQCFQLPAHSRRVEGAAARFRRRPASPVDPSHSRTRTACGLLLPILVAFLYTSLVGAGLFQSLATPLETISHRVDVLARALNIDFTEDIYGGPRNNDRRSTSQASYIPGLEHLHDPRLRSARDQAWEEGVLLRGSDTPDEVERDEAETSDASEAFPPSAPAASTTEVVAISQRRQASALTDLLRQSSLPLVWTARGASALGRLLLRILLIG